MLFRWDDNRNRILTWKTSRKRLFCILQWTLGNQALTSFKPTLWANQWGKKIMIHHECAHRIWSWWYRDIIEANLSHTQTDSFGPHHESVQRQPSVEGCCKHYSSPATPLLQLLARSNQISFWPGRNGGVVSLPSCPRSRAAGMFTAGWRKTEAVSRNREL